MQSHYYNSVDGGITIGEVDSISLQLANEVSVKTENSLEILRLRETLQLQDANSKSETDAMKEELRRMNQLLSRAREDHARASREAEHWKSSYEVLADAVENGEEQAIATP